MTNSVEFQEVEVAVNLNGTIKLRLPANMNPAEAQKIAIERFQQRLHQPFHTGESLDSRAQFHGEVWGDSGNAKVGDLGFEVRHDQRTGVSGAMVGLAPAAGTFGADTLRARVTAYVSRESVFITCREPRSNEEKMIIAAQILNGELTGMLMNPTADQDDDGMTSDLYFTYPGMTSRIN